MSFYFFNRFKILKKEYILIDELFFIYYYYGTKFLAYNFFEFNMYLFK